MATDETLGRHLILRLVDDRILTPTVADRRALARAVLGIGEPFGLILFSVAGTHSHLATLCGRRDAGRLARNLTNSLRRRLELPVSFEVCRIRPINDQAHLRTLPRYILENARKHGTDVDPFHEATNLPDLLGLRVLGAYTRELVKQRLPSLTRSELLACFGLKKLGEGGDLRRLAEAAAAAVGETSLKGRRPSIVRARAAAVRVALDAGARPAWLARQLGLSARGLREVAGRGAEHELTAAIRRQLWLRDRLSA